VYNVFSGVLFPPILLRKIGGNSTPENFLSPPKAARSFHTTSPAGGAALSFYATWREDAILRNQLLALRRHRTLLRRNVHGGLVS
jgi:hypothetical protein